MKPNFVNRTLYHGDNIDFLRGINSETIDLIATDPPFNKGKDFHATPDSLAAGASFQDRWSWAEDVEQAWVDEIKDDNPALMEAIESARHAHSDGMGAFTCFMAVRLLAMHRILKPTGSLFLHCDPTASHYLKAVCDAIFGRKNFRNEIVWCYSTSGRTRDMNWFARKHDNILCYAKSEEAGINNKLPLSEEYIKSHYRQTDENGRKCRIRFDGGSKRVYYPEDGMAGNDWWADMPPLNSQAAERLGYPTQKPLALYRRIIAAASNKGDVVLDPFAGCATTCVAAEQLERQWLGMDLWDDAVNVICERVKKECEKLTGGKMTYTSAVPQRTDDGKVAAPKLRSKNKYAEPGRKMSRDEMKKILIEEHGLVCEGCDAEFDHPDYLQLDHNTPKSQKGLNHISNRLLLCGPCNLRKSNTLTLEGLRRKNKKEGFMAWQRRKKD